MYFSVKTNLGFRKTSKKHTPNKQCVGIQLCSSLLYCSVAHPLHPGCPTSTMPFRSTTVEMHCNSSSGIGVRSSDQLEGRYAQAWGRVLAVLGAEPASGCLSLALIVSSPCYMSDIKISSFCLTYLLACSGLF